MRRSLVVGLVCGGMALAGCANAGRTVTAGDRVGVEFTCRLPDGKIAASTSAQVSSDPAQQISKIFLARKGDGQLLLTAGAGPRGEQNGGSLGFEEVLASRISEQVIGMGEGERRIMQIGAADLPGQHSVRMAAVRVRPKEWRIERAVYVSRTGKEPAVGQAFSMDPLIPGQVSEVAGDQVTLRFSAKEGAEVETPFGPGTIKETPEQYQIVLHPRVGDMVRTGYIVGRISEVDERNFIVDYANPLGGETLSCEVKVAAVVAEAAVGKQKQEER